MRIFLSLASALLLWAFASFASNSPSPNRSSIPLLPRRPAMVLSRKVDLRPQEQVTLHYADGQGENTSNTASIIMKAHKDRPIVLLEDLDFVIKSVTCAPLPASSRLRDVNPSDTVVKITFLSKSAMADALQNWKNAPSLSLISSHAGCNPENERGAWIVSDIRRSYDTNLMLLAESIPLLQSGASLSVSTVQNSVASSWKQKSLHSRDEQEFNANISKILDVRHQLFPLDVSLFGGDSDGNNTAVSIFQSTGTQIFCIQCSFVINFAVITNFDVSVNLDSITVSNASVSTTVNEFDLAANFEVTLQRTLAAKEVELDLLETPIPGLGIGIPGLGFDIGASLGVAIRGEMELTGGINFTIGGKASIPKGALASYNFVDQGNDKGQSGGWDSASISLTPFRLNSGNISANFGLSLSPFIQLGLQISSNRVDARIYVDPPRNNLNTVLRTGMITRECSTYGANDFEWFTAAVTVSKKFQLTADADLEVKSGIFQGLQANLSAELFSVDVLKENTANEACFIISDDSGSNAGASGNVNLVPQVALQVPAAIGTLFPAASAVPSFDIPKIQSYLSAYGSLPTNVNYDQMAQVTQVPSDIQKARKHHINKGAIIGGSIGGAIALLVLIVSIIIWRRRAHGRSTRSPSSTSVSSEHKST